MTIINFRIFTALILLSLLLSVSVAADELTPSVEAAPTEPLLVDLTSMTGIGDMITLGVKAQAYVTTVDPESHEDATHKVAVTFLTEETGVAVEKAKVGIKHRRLFGKASAPVWMNAAKAQPELFISYVTLEKRGTYLFIVGSKLEDNKKRQFTFQFSY
jgi:hypothetical protein